MAWNEFIAEQKKLPYFKALEDFLDSQEQQKAIIYPPKSLWFNALDLTPLDSIKVVIIGQDPYHAEAQAHGLSFSVPEGVKIPPSLRNIYKELSTSIPDYNAPESGNLSHWAEQGVLLLNAVLTVEKGKAASHAGQGWETFTDNIIQAINHQASNVIFLLWGSYAQKKGQFIDTSRHTVLTSSHPSPLSAYRGFLGCEHFKQVNLILEKMNKAPIRW